MEQANLIQQLLDLHVLLNGSNTKSIKLKTRYNTIYSDIYSFEIINSILCLMKNGHRILDINLDDTLLQESTIFHHKNEHRFELVLGNKLPLKQRLFDYFIMNTNKKKNK